MSKLSRVLALCAAPLLAATMATAQDEPSATSSVTAVTIPLKGLTRQNGPKVETALKELTGTTFRCPMCEKRAAAMGDCPDCETGMKAVPGTEALLRDVSVDAANGFATFAVSAPGGVSLTQIEQALTGTDVTVNRANVTVRPDSRIVLSGVDAKHPSSLVQNAIATTKWYETLSVATNDDTKLTTVTLRGGNGASLAHLTDVVAKAGFTVTDVTWTARPTAITIVTPVTVPLKGLTEKNGSIVKTAFMKLTRTTYQCPECGTEAAAKGDCPDCGKSMKAEAGTDLLLGNVSVESGKGLVTFTVSDPDGVRLTEIDAILADTGVAVDRASLAVVPYSRLVVSGVDEKHPASLVQTAVAATKSYETLSVGTDDDTKLTTVTLTGGKGMNLASLTAAVEKAGFKVVDVVWTAPCAACSKRGMMHGNCPGCMDDRS